MKVGPFGSMSRRRRWRDTPTELRDRRRLPLDDQSECPEEHVLVAQVPVALVPGTCLQIDAQLLDEALLYALVEEPPRRLGPAGGLFEECLGRAKYASVKPSRQSLATGTMRVLAPAPSASPITSRSG